MNLICRSSISEFINKIKLDNFVTIPSESDLSEFASTIATNSTGSTGKDCYGSLVAFFNRDSELIIEKLACQSRIVLNTSDELVRFLSTFHAGRYVFIGVLFRDEKIYLIQHVNSLVGIINLSKMFCHLTTNIQLDIKKVTLSFLKVYFNDLSASLKYEESINSLGGLLFNTDARTSHYFYEFLSVLGVRKIADLVISIGKVFYRPNTHFLSLSKLLQTDLIECEFSASDIQDYNFKNNVLILQPSFKRFRAYFSYIPYIDSMLVEKFAIKKSMDSFFPIVWFSVLTEEKSWKQQNDVIISIIIRTIKNYKNPFFIFDGTTSAINTNNNFPCRSDVSYILQSVGFDFNFKDLQGAHADLKISYASVSNIFLTSMGSDSLYPSRIAGKPGVVHCSQAVSYFNKHRYSPKTIKSDPSLSSYLSGQDHIRPDKRSYSLSGDYIIGLFWKCFYDNVHNINEGSLQNDNTFPN